MKTITTKDCWFCFFDETKLKKLQFFAYCKLVQQKTTDNEEKKQLKQNKKNIKTSTVNLFQQNVVWFIRISLINTRKKQTTEAEKQFSWCAKTIKIIDSACSIT